MVVSTHWHSDCDPAMAVEGKEGNKHIYILIRNYKRHGKTLVYPLKRPCSSPCKELDWRSQICVSVAQSPGADSSFLSNSTSENLLKLHCCLQHPKEAAGSAVYLQSSIASYFSHPNATSVCKGKTSTFELNSQVNIVFSSMFFPLG